MGGGLPAHGVFFLAGGGIDALAQDLKPFPAVKIQGAGVLLIGVEPQGRLVFFGAVQQQPAYSLAAGVLAAVGGKGNVKNVEYCATRLRFEIKDYTAVDEKAVKAAGAAGVIRPSKNACQVIIGTKVQFVYDELKKML